MELLKREAAAAHDVGDLVTALSRWEQVIQDEDTSNIQSLSDALTQKGIIVLTRGVQEALLEFKKAAALWEKGSRGWVDCIITQSAALFREHQPQLSVEILHGALTETEPLKDENGLFWMCLAQLTSYALNQDQDQQMTLDTIDGALAGLASVFGDRSKEYCLVLTFHARLLGHLGQVEESIEEFERALEVLSEGESRSDALKHAASVYCEKGDFETGLKCFDEAARIRASLHANGVEHSSVALVRVDIAAEYYTAERYDETIKHLEMAIPFLDMKPKAIEANYNWMRKCHQLLGSSADVVDTQLRQLGQKRSVVLAKKRALPPNNIATSAFKMPAPKKKGKPVPPPRSDPLPSDRCAACGNTVEKLLQCSVCQSIYYCGKECQKADWKQHKPNCKTKK